MLNNTPNSQEHREDLPIFDKTVTFDVNPGIYYIGANGLVGALADAAVYDNGGQRWLRGIKAFMGNALASGKALTVTPMVSLNDGATFGEIAALACPISGNEPDQNRRNAVFLRSTDLATLADKAVVVYKVSFSQKVKGTLSVVLYLF